MTPDILFQDDQILVVDKPAGIAVLPDGWDPQASYLLKELEERSGRLWVVHRLDKGTSGVMLFARTAEAHRCLNVQLERREAHKTYHAIVTGSPNWDAHTARHPLRINVGHSHRTVVDDAKGKPSETHFQVLERFDTASLLEASPATGRTHQIRVHAYALGIPLLGDTLYSAPQTDVIRRPALHALRLSFLHPQTGEVMEFQAPYPQDFSEALARLRKGT
jgi:RluA family pseudouridine synthase